MKRVDQLDIAFAAGGIIVAVGLLVAAATSWEVGRIVAAPGAIAMASVTFFGLWWDDPREALPAPRFVGGLLPWFVILGGCILAGGAAVRMFAGDDEWFTRYVMSTFWFGTGLTGAGHGIARLRGRRGPATAAL